MPYEDRNIRQALLQTLENYQRCGLKWIEKAELDELPNEWLGAIEVATSQSEADALASELAVPRSNPEPQPPPTAMPPRTVAPKIPELRGPEPPAEVIGGHAWSRSSLDDSQRQAVFAELSPKIRECRLCSEICRYRHQTVFGVGPIRPTVCFMGEAPGADEDRLGEPFVGRAGQLLTKIIQAMTLKREDVYILNALKCRPPNNRTPLPDEIANCRPFVETQLETLQPQYIVCLGAVAVRSLLDSTTSIGRMRGRFYPYRGAKVVVTYHPSYLLRNESAKKFVWEDMQMLMREMGLKKA